MPRYKLVFRGDTRGPDEKEGPFQIGFKSRDYDSPSRTEVPEQFGSDETGFSDVNIPTAVCVSADIAAAVIFPQGKPPDIWVYAMGIDTKDPQTLNVHGQQVISHKGQTKGSAPPIYWYAQELAVKAVPVEQIAAGMQVSRKFGKDGDAESFKVCDIVRNLKCGISDHHWALLDRYLRDLQGRWIPAVKTADGFISRSLGRKLEMKELKSLFENLN